MKCERFVFRGNLSILLIKVKITSSATIFVLDTINGKSLVLRYLNLAPVTIPSIARFRYAA